MVLTMIALIESKMLIKLLSNRSFTIVVAGDVR